MYSTDPYSVQQLRRADLIESEAFHRGRRWVRRPTVTERAATWWQRVHKPTLLDPSHELFAGLDRRTLNRLAKHFTFADLAEGEALARQGETTSEFTVVLDGQIGVTLDGLPVAVFDTGSHFGALPLLDGSPDRFAVASFDALETTRVAVASAIQFREIVGRHPLIADRVRRVAERRRAYLQGHADAKAMFADQAAHPFPVHIDIDEMV